MCSLLLLLAIIAAIYIKKKKPELFPNLKRSSVPRILVPEEEGPVIFKKGASLKNNIVSATEDEKRRFEEFKDLEAEVAETITPVKTKGTSLLEENTKHNRYRDIGRIYSILLQQCFGLF